MGAQIDRVTSISLLTPYTLYLQCLAGQQSSRSLTTTRISHCLRGRCETLEPKAHCCKKHRRTRMTSKLGMSRPQLHRSLNNVKPGRPSLLHLNCKPKPKQLHLMDTRSRKFKSYTRIIKRKYTIRWACARLIIDLAYYIQLHMYLSDLYRCETALRNRLSPHLTREERVVASGQGYRGRREPAASQRYPRTGIGASKRLGESGES